MSPPVQRVAVVGGGVSGLSTAYYLRNSGCRTTLIESAPRLGGVIRTDRVQGCLVEAGPDSFLAQKPWALELIRELGLADQVIGSNDARRKTYIVRDGELLPLPDGLQFLAPTKILPMLRTRLFSARAKLSMARELLRRPVRVGYDRSIAEFVRDHYGTEAVEYLAQPLLAGVYGGSPESLSVESVMPRFVEIERSTGSVSRALARASRAKPDSKPGPLFLTLKDGLGVLIEALERAIRPSVEVVQGEVLSFRKTPRGARLETSAGPFDVDHAVLAAPAHRAAAIVRPQDEWLATLLDAVSYNSSITCALIYDAESFSNPLDGFGFLVPRLEKRTLAACTWVNTKFDHRAGDGRVLLRAFLAGDAAEARMGRDDDEIIDEAQREIGELMGVSAAPLAGAVSRWPRAMAQYEVDHRRLVGWIEERLAEHPGLHLTGNAYAGIGIPDCVRRGREIAERISADKSRRS